MLRNGKYYIIPVQNDHLQTMLEILLTIKTQTIGYLKDLITTYNRPRNSLIIGSYFKKNMKTFLGQILRIMEKELISKMYFKVFFKKN